MLLKTYQKNFMILYLQIMRFSASTVELAKIIKFSSCNFNF